MSYIKLDTRILTSTLWADTSARNVFIAALLMAEPWEFTEPQEQIEVRNFTPTGFIVPPGWYGFVRSAGVGIAHAARVSDEEGYKALEMLGSEDPESRNPAFGGRRMVRVKGGYVILTFMDHRDHDHSAKERMQRLRARRKEIVTANVPNVTRNSTVTTGERYAGIKQKADASVVDVVDGGHAIPTVPYVPQKEGGGENPPICSAAQAEAERLRHFKEPAQEPEETYVPSARMRALADAFSQHLKVTQSLDFNLYVAGRAAVVDAAPEKEVLDVVEYVLVRDTKGYWKGQMLDEDEGRGGLKVFVRGYSKIKDIAKSKGKGGRMSAQPAARSHNKQVKQNKAQVVYKAESVKPAPEDLILQGESL